jgi:hypothetical protein
MKERTWKDQCLSCRKRDGMSGMVENAYGGAWAGRDGNRKNRSRGKISKRQLTVTRG